MKNKILIKDATGFKILNWMLYTSTDMVNRRDHPIVIGTGSAGGNCNQV
jgi:hypothetical protein